MLMQNGAEKVVLGDLTVARLILLLTCSSLMQSHNFFLGIDQWRRLYVDKHPVLRGIYGLEPVGGNQQVRSRCSEWIRETLPHQFIGLRNSPHVRPTRCGFIRSRYTIYNLLVCNSMQSVAGDLQYPTRSTQ
jgi:hypothetical protein